MYASRWAGSDTVLGQVLDSTNPSPYSSLTELDWQYHATCSPDTLVQSLDYLAIEAVYLLSSAGLSVSQPVWLGLGLSDEPVEPTAGILIPVECLADYRQLRAAVRFLKGLFRDAVQTGVLSRWRAYWLLLGALWNYCAGESPCPGGTRPGGQYSRPFYHGDDNKDSDETL